MSDWRMVETPAGTVEFLSAEWEPDDGTEPPGTIRVRVNYTLDGHAGSRVVLMSSADFESGEHSSNPREDG